MDLRKELNDIIPYMPDMIKEGAIKLNSNENPSGVAPKAIKIIKSLAPVMNFYPDGSCLKLKQKLSLKYSLNPENFIIGNGSDDIIMIIAGAFAGHDNNAVTSETTFSSYTFAVKYFGGAVKYAEMREGRFQLDEILQKTDKKTRLIFLCNPNNPTGTYFNHNTLSDFMKRVPEDVLVVIDEAYREYVKARDYPDTRNMLDDFDNMIILRTFSKIYGLAGLRVGYGMGNKALIECLDKTRDPFNVNAMGQEAAAAALFDTGFIKKSVEINEAGKKYLYKEFERLGLAYYPSETNFVFVTINKDSIETFERLLELGVAVRPMKSFGADNAIRVTVGTAGQNEFFIKQLEKIL